MRPEAALERPADEVPRFAGVERDEVDRFAGPFDALFGVRVAMMPKVRRRHRGTRVGTPYGGSSSTTGGIDGKGLPL
ncbi:hypothetical protein GCM10020216_022080 [Nonomuraea helvata]